MTPRAPSAPDPVHWAPDHLVLGRRLFTYAGWLEVDRDDHGVVMTTSPLAGMAAVEQRYPAWALGPFGRISTRHRLPRDAGVFALVEAGVARYVGASAHLERTFSHRNGIGELSRKDCQDPDSAERCHLNHRITRAAEQGRTIDLYILVPAPSDAGRLTRALRGALPPARTADPDRDPEAVAAHIRTTVRGTWQLS